MLGPAEDTGQRRKRKREGKDGKEIIHIKCFLHNLLYKMVSYPACEADHSAGNRALQMMFANDSLTFCTN